jgi:ATP-dependent RNA helicase DeaD
VKVRGTEKSAVAPPARLRYWQVDSAAKLNALTRIFEVEPGFDAALVFVRDKATALKLTEKLRARGYAAEALGADSPRKQRTQVFDRFRNGAIDIVVGTDLAVEGLDATRLTHVVSYDMPCDAASHVRRIAHLDKAKRGATAILLVAPREMAMLHSIEHATRQVIAPQVLPERYR